MRYVTIGTKAEFKLFNLRLPDGSPVSDSPEPVWMSPEFATSMLFQIFDKAHITDVDQAALLGIPAETLKDYRGQESIPHDRLVLDRIEAFLRCYILLKVLYVRDYELIYQWLTAENTAVPPNPIEHMKRFGIGAVRDYLEGVLCR